MAEARRKGGRAKSNKARARKQLATSAMTPVELEGVLGQTIEAVLAGTQPPGVGQAIAALVRASMTIRQAGEFEQRLSAVEQRADLDVVLKGALR